MTAKTAGEAIAINEGGACNPRGIARALVPALDDDPSGPAARLILHQLVWIVWGVDLYVTTSRHDWEGDRDHCRAAVNAGVER